MMLSVAEYARQEQALGRSVHFHDGVWWQSPVPGYSVPLLRETVIAPHTARPALARRLLGYSHVVPARDGSVDGASAHVPMVRKAGATTFDITELNAGRRSKVRRGLKKSTVGAIHDMRPYLDDAMAIAMAARSRTGSGLPVAYYRKHGARWKEALARASGLPGRHVFGAVLDGRLVSYLFCTAVDGAMYIGAAKNHDEALGIYANDALVYSVLDFAFNTLRAVRVHYGDFTPDDEPLNYFKASYGFEPVTMPTRVYLRPAVSMLYAQRRRLQSLRPRTT